MAVQQGDVIGSITCDSCGAEVKMKVSKNKTVYTICNHIIEPETRERCGHRQFIGRVKSKEIIKAYEGTQKHEPIRQDQAGEQPARGTATDNTAASNAAARERGGIFSGFSSAFD